MIRKASAVWLGDLKTGSGTLSAPSGVRLLRAEVTLAATLEG